MTSMPHVHKESSTYLTIGRFEDRSTLMIRICLMGVAACSFGNFSEHLVPGNSLVGSFLPQQFLALSLWVLMAWQLFIRKVSISSLPKKLVVPLVLLIYAVVSPLWGADPALGLAKTLLLLFVTITVWRLTFFISVQGFFDCIWKALASAVTLSMVVSIIFPSVGVLDDWNHAGKWAGIFQTKQDLGFASATLIYLTSLRLATNKKLMNWIVLFVAIVCVLQSGSRGGAAEALVAVAVVFLGFKVKGMAKFFAFFPVFFSSIGFLAVVFFSTSGLTYFPILGEEVDLTSRTFIWSFSIKEFVNRPLLGFGINQFWNIQQNIDSFTGFYGWFLDNYHSGYVAIAVELGIVGMILFFISTLILTTCLLRLLRFGAQEVTRVQILGLSGFLFLIYLINLTETYFFRSTSFYQVMFTFFFLKIVYLSLRRSRLGVKL